MPKFEKGKFDMGEQTGRNAFIGKDTLLDAKNTAKEISKIRGVSAVYLFGSYAKGTQRPYSDIDICVITGNIDEKTKGEILMHASRKIETHIMADLPLNIQFRVLQEGKPLCVNSKEKLLDTRFNVIRAYQDFRPRLERYWRRVLA